jgi:hypothetical protein
MAEANLKYMRKLRAAPSAAVDKKIQQWWKLGALRIFAGTSGLEVGSMRSRETGLRELTGKGAAVNFLMDMLSKSDALALRDGWRIAEAEGRDYMAGSLRESGPSAEYWQGRPKAALDSPAFYREVAKRADFLVRRTQSMFDVSGRSVQSGSEKPLYRSVFGLMRSYVDQNLHIVQRAAIGARSGNISMGRFARQVGVVAVQYAIAGALMESLRSLRRGQLPSPKGMAVSIATAPLGMMNVIGYPIAWTVNSMLKRALGLRGGRVEPPSVRVMPLEPIEDTGSAAMAWADVVKAKDAKTREKKAVRAMLQTLRALKVFGVPTQLIVDPLTRPEVKQPDDDRPKRPTRPTRPTR